jgi:hypothetical protein
MSVYPIQSAYQKLHENKLFGVFAVADDPDNVCIPAAASHYVPSS